MGARRGCAWQRWRLRLYTSAGVVACWACVGSRVAAGRVHGLANGSKRPGAWHAPLAQLTTLTPPPAATANRSPADDPPNHQHRPRRRRVNGAHSKTRATVHLGTLLHLLLYSLHAFFRYLPPTSSSTRPSVATRQGAGTAFTTALGAPLPSPPPRGGHAPRCPCSAANEYRAPCEHTQSRRTLLPKGSPAYHTDNGRELASNPKIAQIDLTRRLRSPPRRNIYIGEIEV